MAVRKQRLTDRRKTRSAPPRRSPKRQGSARRAANTLNLFHMSNVELAKRARNPTHKHWRKFKKLQAAEAKRRAAIPRKSFRPKTAARAMVPQMKLVNGKLVVNNKSLVVNTKKQVHSIGQNMTQRVANAVTANMSGLAAPTTGRGRGRGTMAKTGGAPGAGRGRGRGRGKGAATAAVAVANAPLTLAELSKTSKKQALSDICKLCGVYYKTHQHYTERLRLCKLCGTVAPQGNETWVLNMEGRGQANNANMGNIPRGSRSSSGSKSGSKSGSPKKK